MALRRANIKPPLEVVVDNLETVPKWKAGGRKKKRFRLNDIETNLYWRDYR